MIRKKLFPIKMDIQSTITLTFGDQAENHVGMQKIGQLADCGFSFDDLSKAKENFELEGCKCELINLNAYIDTAAAATVPGWMHSDTAYILIIRKAVNYILGKHNKNANDLLIEQNSLNTDKKAKMYGRVVNKNARYNLCFSDTSQEPDYEAGKGRIIAFSDVPLTNLIKCALPNYFGDKALNLALEGNYYYDIKKCGIGFHGDGERKKVIAIRLGHNIPLHYQWFLNSIPVFERIKFSLDHGDMYVMSEKATGFDWKKKLIPTLRHAAGADKFLVIKNV